jgi:septum site-determining protein MinD
MNRITAVISAKGGVGKTTITANLGLALHQSGRETILVDGDFKNPNLALHLGILEYSYNFQDVLERGGNILEALHIHKTGLRIIPSSLSLKHTEIVIKKFRELFQNIKGHILVDSPPGLGEDVISLMKASDDVIIVTTPEIPAITDALKSIEIARNMEKKIRGIIVNRTGRKKYEIRPEEIAAVSGLQILGVVPEDENVLKSVMHKTPILEFNPYSNASIAIRKIASEMTGEEYQKPRFLRLKRLIFRT